MADRSPFPDCWKDDERMNYLFSHFRGSRQLNPNDWDTKMNFWTNCVQRYCRFHRTVYFHSSSLAQAFKRKDAVPQGIEDVLKELNRSGKIVRKEDFESSVGESWISWGSNLMVSRPSRWMFNAVFRGNDILPPAYYVHIHVVKEFADNVLSRHYGDGMNDDVIALDVLQSQIADICDKESCDLVISYLQKMKKLLIHKLADGQTVVKFAASQTSNVDPVTESEIGLYKVKKTVESLTKQLEQLALEVQEFHQQARANIQKGLKTSAKNCLRKKKLTQQRLERRENTRETLQMILEKIEAAESDKMIMDAYKAGSSALKSTLQQNLTAEKVDDTLSEVQEVLEMCNEINNTWIKGQEALDETVGFGADIDIDALEAELASLGEDDVVQDSLAVPSVPDELPSVPDNKLETGESVKMPQKTPAC